MKTRHLFFLGLFLCQFAFAQSGKGTLKGRIKSADGEPAAFVPVGLKGTKYGTTTDNSGKYEFKAPAGTYTLLVQFVGHEPEEKAVEIKENETAEVEDFTLVESLKELQEVVVTGGRNVFAQKETDYVARLPLKNLENPQVYSVVTKELMQEQITTDYNAAFRNAPGVTPSANPAGSVDVAMRGFNASTSIRNGMASQSWTMVDPVNIERTEIVKGPSGTLFPSSLISFGGLINRVTKKPFDIFKGEVSYYTGSYDLNRLTVDVNTPLNVDKTVLFRVNAAAHNENSFQNYGHQRTYTIAPSLLYKVNNKLTLLLDVELYQAKKTQLPYYFIDSSVVSFRNFKDMRLPYKSSLGGEDINAQHSSTNYFAQATYKISKSLTSTTNFTSSNNRIDYSYQFYPTWINDTTVAREIDLYGPRSFTTIDLQQNFNHDITIGRFRNRVVAGFDINYYTGKQKVAWADYDTVNTAQPFAPMTKTGADALIGKFARTSRASQLNYSGYVSNVISLDERLMLMASLRVDAYRNFNSYRNDVDQGDDYFQSALSPKLGLVYQPIKEKLSLFANYMNGFINVAPVEQPNGKGISIFKPQQANQWEIGAKADLFNHKLNATVSYYNIQVTNAVRTNTDRSIIQDGTQNSKGMEVELIANPFTGFNIIAGYAHNDNIYTKADEGVEGKTNPGAPKETVNLWLSYKLSSTAFKGLGTGFGTNYVSQTYWDSGNIFVLPEYTLLSATLFYDQPKWRIGIKGNNLTDQHYWSFNGTPQQLSQYTGSFTFRF